MTFNSRLAKLAEKLAEETFPLKMYLDESLPKLAQSSFTRGALHPTIIQAVRMEGARWAAAELGFKFARAENRLARRSAEGFADMCEAELQRLLSEGGEN